MKSRSEFLEIFNDFLAQQIQVKEPKLLYEPIKYALDTGGKRIRPVLMMLANQMFNDNYSKVLFPALGLEVFHNFTLLHDDIMDKSAMRRNKPTVHTKWNDNVAILSGDAMSIMASQCVMNAEANHKPLIDSFNQAAMDVCEGQQYDMDFEDVKHINEEDYMKMISLKTGALLAVALKMGGIIADAQEKDIQHLYDFGMYMGIGFQLQDDWLDCFGDESKFGKLIGKDILNEKKTFLYIKAYELANEEQKNTLDHAFENYDLAASDKIEFVLNIYRELEIGELTREKSIEYFNKAARELEAISVSEEKKAELTQFLNYLEKRSY